jgi:TonB family protein
METDDTALEIVPVWMDTVVHVVHMVPGEKTRPYSIGEDPRTNFNIVSEHLSGQEKWDLVWKDGSIHVPPCTDSVEIVRADGTRLEGAEAGSVASLALGDRMRLTIGSVTFVIRAVRAARKLKLPVSFDWVSVSFTGASFALNVALLGLAFFFPPDTSKISHDTDFEQSRWGRILEQSVEIKMEELPAWMQEQVKEDKEPEGGDGERHDGDEGQMGDSSAKKSDKMYGIKGDAKPDERQLAKDIREQVSKTGILSALNQPLNMPTSPFGGDRAIGSDHESALGALMGASIGPNFGFGGMGVIGSGDGGGGKGEGTIGLGSGVWTKIGHGGGGGPDGVGYCKSGVCNGGLDKKGGTKVPPQVKIKGEGQVIGCLSKEAIRRVIRQHINEVKHCYEKGLMDQPDLEGQVTVKFSINMDGTVGASKIQSSTIGDDQVGQCVAKAVSRWSFPPLQGCGVVMVSYPFSFVPASTN